MTLTVTIPGTPPREVSPNARVGWQARARHTKAYRQTAYLATMAAGRVAFDGDRPVYLALRYAWETGRKSLDHDNALALAKAGLDGVADALGVNDRQFRCESVEQVRDPEGRGFTVIELWQGGDG
ncbi:MAG: endodeoxyribonuclease RusA [Chloroflexota bacterium]|nr:endodeoxyribonuclease RusA [Chloroflexota bacterium]